MLRRTRTTKKLARRIDLQYFTRPHPLRRWRLWLSLAVPLLALGWLLIQRAQGSQAAYSRGPLSQSHAVFTEQCSLCHVTRAGAFFKEVSDEACLSCHDGPQHQANQTFAPKCSTCHMEHRGAVRLSATTNASCTQCHTHLVTKDGHAHYSSTISNFDGNHPEFSALAPGRSDPAQVKLNHFLHLQPNLLASDGRRVQMSCDDCHRPAPDSRPWPYSAEALPTSTPSGTTPPYGRRGAYMVPIRFATHCAGCHTLQFDTRFGNQQVPHDKPEVVHTFLIKKFEDYIAGHPSAIREVVLINRQVPEDAPTPRMARNATEWVQFRTEDAERLLWAKTCKQCHVLVPNGSSIPQIAATNIAGRWLEHAEFDHRSHRMMTCASCHSHAVESHNTADILLPGIATCRQCHREQSSSKDSAEGRCFECHQYHDWSNERRTNRQFTIPELRGTAKLVVPKESPIQ